MLVGYEDSLELASASVERSDAANGYRDTVAHSDQEIARRRDHLTRQLIDLLSKLIWQRRGHSAEAVPGIGKSDVLLDETARFHSETGLTVQRGNY